MIWRWDFPLFLTIATLLTGVVYVLDRLYWSKRRPAGEVHMPWAIEWARSFFPVLLLVWGIRSFWWQPYRVPSGSLEPTVVQGDFLLATQYNYGLFFPAGHIKLLGVGKPKIGDIVLFHPPAEAHSQTLFVKRVIGLPGDRVQYHDKQLTINGQAIKRKYLGDADNYINMDGQWKKFPAHKYEENLFGIKHNILIEPGLNEMQDVDVVVPEGKYFMMGDNRDFSEDSRYWGAVASNRLVGKAWRIVMSWSPFDASVPWYRLDQKIRWSRVGIKL